MKLSNETYDLLKKIALMVLPLATFLAAIGSIWHVPALAEISATLAALDTFIGAMLNSSSKKYHSDQGDEDKGEE